MVAISNFSTVGQTNPGNFHVNEPGLPEGQAPSSSSGNTLPVSGGNSTAIASPALPTDQLATTNQVSWRGVPFPVAEFKEAGGQSLSVHEYPNLDGARVEPMGRKPLQFAIRAVLTNNVYPSNNETWPQGFLYPGVFNQLLAYFYNDASMPAGQLSHPSLPQPIYCRVVSWDYEYRGDGPRDGVFLEFALIETNEQQTITLSNGNMPIINSEQQTALNNPPFQPPNLNLGQFLTQLSTAVNQITRYPANTIDALNSQLAQLNASTQSIAASLITAVPQTIGAQQQATAQFRNSLIQGSVLNAYNGTVVGNNFFGGHTFAAPSTSDVGGNTSLNVDPASLNNVYTAAFSLNNTSSGHAGIFLQKTMTLLNSLIYYYGSMNNVQAAPVKMALELLLGQVQLAQENLYQNVKGMSVQQYTVSQNTSIVSLVRYLNQTMDDFLVLNPFASKTYYIPINTTVNYYQS